MARPLLLLRGSFLFPFYVALPVSNFLKLRLLKFTLLYEVSNGIP
jgi:hypothetical protein